MWLLASQCSLLDGGSEQTSVTRPSLRHVVLLKHPAPIGGHLNSLPAPYGLRYSSTSPLPRPVARKEKKKKESISNKVETGFPLHPRKARLRLWVNTFMPRGPYEIKHQRHALYVSQKHRPCLLHLTIWVLHVHVCWTQLRTAAHSHTGQRSRRQPIAY